MGNPYGTSTIPAVYMRAITEMCQYGYTYIPIDSDLLSPVCEGWGCFLETQPQAETDVRLQCLIPGEHEPDLGFFPPRPQKDNKYLLHYHPLLFEMLQNKGNFDQSVWTLLEACRPLYAHLKLQTICLLRALDQEFGCAAAAEFVESTERLQAYETSMLRCLAYPAVPAQTGAAPHWDKCTLTHHLFSSSGALCVVDASGNRVDIPARSNHMVIFPGVKILELTHKQVKPLYHSARTETDRRRIALAFFAHTSTTEPVIDAAEAYARYVSQG